MRNEKPIVRRAHVQVGDADPVGALTKGLGTDPLRAVIAFVAPGADFAAFVRDLSRAIPDTQIVACTTAGEIGAAGYASDSIVAVGLPVSHFRARLLVIPDLSEFDSGALAGQMLRLRTEMAREAPEFEHELGFLLVDGLSTKEDELTAVLGGHLGRVPLFGGSAADGTVFERTLVAANGAVYHNAAVLTLVRTACPVKAFKTDHATPVGERMVVTEAEPIRRIVRELNAEPAAHEYARIVGIDAEALSLAVFAANPVVVRVGNIHHIRGIRQATAAGELVFFCAIDEGLVLSLARPDDMVGNLQRQLEALGESGRPDVIIACEGLLRRIEATEEAISGDISALLRDHRVVGFSTYGEQIGSMHVNQTLTGVAIYPPLP